MIYRLPCGKALSVRKSLRAVRTVGRNRYIENTPLGTPSGTAVGWKRLFFWLQKSGVNNRKRRRYHRSRIQPLRHASAVPLAASRRRFAPLPLTAHASAYAILAFADGGSRNSSFHPPPEALGISTLAQGSRDSLRKPSGEKQSICSLVKAAPQFCLRRKPRRRFRQAAPRQWCALLGSPV